MDVAVSCDSDGNTLAFSLVKREIAKKPNASWKKPWLFYLQKIL
jgi:hypothetical protein